MRRSSVPGRGRRLGHRPFLSTRDYMRALVEARGGGSRNARRCVRWHSDAKASNMTRFGYHASHEQYLRATATVRPARRVRRLRGPWCSTTFIPGPTRRGTAGSRVLASVRHSRRRRCRSDVNAPGDRYHSRDHCAGGGNAREMFPERFVLAIGSGEALTKRLPQRVANEARAQRAAEGVRRVCARFGVARRYASRRVTVQEARLYSLPDTPPLLLGAALSPETASSSADGPTDS